MNTCKTCKFWGRAGDPGHGEHKKAHVCIHPKLRCDSREWKESSDGAEQWGNDAGYVTWATFPDFGCIHHSFPDGPTKMFEDLKAGR